MSMSETVGLGVNPEVDTSRSSMFTNCLYRLQETDKPYVLAVRSQAREPLLSITPGTTRSDSDCSTRDASFSRHDSLFSFGVSSSRNAAELKSLLGDATSRLKPGATVLSLHDPEMGRASTRKHHAVSLEQAKPRARVEVDIILESDCCIEGGYMRGHVLLRVRKRQKKEAPLLLAQGKVRVIGFECIPGEADRDTFYQRASLLSELTDAYTGIYDSLPDAEGYSRAMEGIHMLPFAMHLPIDNTFGSAKGSLSLHSGVHVRYIAMVSVKVKDPNTGKRSIAHFYRDCQVWPRLNPSVVLASAPRPIQATTAKSLSVIGNGSKLKLTAMLHRMTWIAGQRCYVHVRIANDTKKHVKSMVLTLVRTTTLFKPKPHLDPGNALSVDPDACQTATTHKVVAETVLERGQAAVKGHASAEGWWTGVQAGQEARFSHYVLIPVEALSVSRSRLLEVEYSIRVTASAGALAPDVHVTLPVRVINFLSVDPTPGAPLLAPDGSYVRLIPYAQSLGSGSLCADAPPSAAGSQFSSTAALDNYNPSATAIAFVPSLGAPNPLCVPLPQADTLSRVRHPSTIVLNTPPGAQIASVPATESSRSTGNERNETDEEGNEDPPVDDSMVTSSESESSICSANPQSPSSALRISPIRGRELGNLDLDDDAGSDEEVDFVVGTAEINAGCFLQYSRHGCNDVDQEIGDARSMPRVDPMQRESSNSEAYAPTSYVTPETVFSRPRYRSNLPSDRRCGSDDLLDRNKMATGPFSERSVHAGPSRNVGSPGFAAGPHPSLSETCGRRRQVVAGPPSGSWEHHDHGSASLFPARHNREGASRDTQELARRDLGAEDEDKSATPRLSASFTASIPPRSAREGDTAPASTQAALGSGSESHLRLSRQLPQPPPRPSHLCDIPASVSALEVLHMSQLYVSCPIASVDPGAALQLLPTSRATLSRSTAPRSLPASPARLKLNASTLPNTVSSEHHMSRLACEHAVPSSISSTGVHQRPDKALRNTGQSECSIVKGRIAAFEERLKGSVDSGAAYA